MRPVNCLPAIPKANRTAARNSAFVLSEMVVVCALLAMFASFSAAVGTSALGRYSDPYSDFRIEAEVRELADRLRSAVNRSLVERRDFRLRIYEQGPAQCVGIKWQDAEEELWRLDKIGVSHASNMGGEAASLGNSYSSSFQTITPAVNLRVYAIGMKDKPQPTPWRITISAYGFVSIIRN